MFPHITNRCGILRAETRCKQTLALMQSSCVCCPGSQIISQTKTISTYSSLKNVCLQQRPKKTWECTTIHQREADMTGKHVEEGRHDIRSMNSHKERSQYNPRMLKKHLENQTISEY